VLQTDFGALHLSEATSVVDRSVQLAFALPRLIADIVAQANRSRLAHRRPHGARQPPRDRPICPSGVGQARVLMIAKMFLFVLRKDGL
jgi:hypothetical protein